MRYRTIQLTRRSRPPSLHIEAPGCIVNIDLLTDSEGRNVTRVDVNANGDRYAGEPEWWCIDAGATLEPRGIGVRVVQGTPRPEEPTSLSVEPVSYTHLTLPTN